MVDAVVFFHFGNDVNNYASYVVTVQLQKTAAKYSSYSPSEDRAKHAKRATSRVSSHTADGHNVDRHATDALER